VILGLDTATRTVALGLVEGERLVGEVALAGSSAKTRELMAAIEGLLNDGGVAPRDLRAIAVGLGPGSFTGVRVGLALAHGLALGLGIPVVGVSTLACVAANASPEIERVTVMLDAGRGEVFLGHFRRLAGNLEPVGAARAVTPEEASREAADPGLVIGDGWLRYRSEIAARLGPGVRWLDDDASRARGGIVARLGTVERAGLDPLAPAIPLEPVYVRAPDARPSPTKVAGSSASSAGPAT